MTDGWRYLGHGLPYLKLTEQRGFLIAIEGGDRSGCTTQTRLLETGLNSRGYRVVRTGIGLSSLAGDLVAATKGNALGNIASSLVLATDLAGELESRVLPALQEGTVVLADRYAFGLMARLQARGPAAAHPGCATAAAPDWLERVLGFALAPDLTLYLRTAPEDRLRRVFASPQPLDGSGIGMDMDLIQAGFGNCLAYQRRVEEGYARLAAAHGFAFIDGSATAAAVQEQMRSRVLTALEAPGAPATQRDDPHLARVLAMCEKYQYEEPHCMRVAALARQLFDLLQPWHGLEADYATVLYHGALLHDIGRFIHPRDHNDHGASLIQSDRLLDGYPQAGREVLALLALNHRGAPTPPPPEWAPELARAAMQLSAILRLADGLDRERRGGVTIAEYRVTPCQIRLRALGLDLKSQARALKAKAALFPQAFGRVVRLLP